jgi:uncharacterized protein (DUF2236 family)
VGARRARRRPRVKGQPLQCTGAGAFDPVARRIMHGTQIRRRRRRGDRYWPVVRRIAAAIRSLDRACPIHLRLVHAVAADVEAVDAGP